VYRLGDGALLPAKTPKARPSLNPANISEIVGYVEFGDIQDAETALQKIHRGSKAWNKSSAETRIRLVDSLADWMQERRDELAAWILYEAGKSWKEADADVCEAIDFCRYYAREMQRLSQPILTQEVAGERNHILYRPRGVSLVIAPWNFPLAILTGMTVASLVTG